MTYDERQWLHNTLRTVEDRVHELIAAVYTLESGVHKTELQTEAPA